MCYSASIAFRVTCMHALHCAVTLSFSNPVPFPCGTNKCDVLRDQICLYFLFLQLTFNIRVRCRMYAAECLLPYVCYRMYAAQAPIGPKQTHVVQTQRYSLHGPDWHVLPPAGPDGRSSAPIQAVVLDHSSQMLDIPYSTYFTVEETWAATQHPTKPKCCTLVMGLEVCLSVCVLCMGGGGPCARSM